MTNRILLKRYITNQLKVFLLEIFERIRLYYKALLCKVNQKPIFIIGNQKSGTTAIAALLAKMTDLSVTLDLVEEIRVPKFNYVYKKELPFSYLIRRNKIDFSRDIIKEPNLTFFYEQLSSYFKQAKFIFIVRDPRDNIRSMLNRWNIPGNLEGIEAGHLAKISPARMLVLDNRWLGVDGGNYIEVLAKRWNFFADIFLNHAEETVLVRYEDFVKDKIGTIENLTQQLGLKKTNDISEKVDFPFQPPGDRTISWQDFYGEKNLKRIEQICKEKMLAFGYSTNE
ncbi:sulfotransferase [Candidatus Omnitrophota bacterium]